MSGGAESAGIGAGGAGRRARLLFALLQAIFLATSTGRPHVVDEWSAFFQARGLATTGAIAIPAADLARFEFYGKVDLEGRARAPYGPAQAIALAPFYAVGAGLSLAPCVPADEQAQTYVRAFAVTIASTTFAALAAALFLLLLERRGVAPGAALLAALALAFGTPIFGYSGWGFSEPLTGALFMGAALAAFGDDGPVRVARASLAGALLAVAILVRPAHALAAALFGAAILLRDGRRGVAPFLVLGAITATGLAAYLAWNAHQFGDPLDFGYPAHAERGRALNTFQNPLAVGIFGFLASPGKSVFLFAPPALAALAGLRALWRRDRGLASLAVLLPVGYVLLYAKYTQWEGGYCFGPRYIVPAVPLLLLPLGWRLTQSGRGFRGVVLALLVAGALVQATGLATSYLEDERHGGYYDEHLDYRLGHCPIASQGALLLHYATAPAPAPLGKGFDRWFIFLSKLGVDGRAIGALLAIEALGALAAGVALAKAIGAHRGGPADDSPAPS